MPKADHLTVADLLAYAPLGLELVSDAPTTARIRAAHAIEIAHPGRWLKAGSVMLTTGLRLVGVAPGSGLETELVEELVAADVSALLFGVGVHFPTVPRPLVTAASMRHLPLLAVPPEVPFFQVEDFVNSWVQGGDAHPARRMLWLQNDLLQSLAEPQPVNALVHRLAALVKGTAVVYEETGRHVASVGEGPTRLIWSELRTRLTTRQSFAVGLWHVIARPVSVRGVGFWIALASRRESTIEDLGDALLESAQRIFSAVSGVRALGATQMRAESAQLLRQLSDGVTTEEEDRIWDRLRSFRFTPRHPIRFFDAIPRVPEDLSPESGQVRPDQEDLLSFLHDEAQLSGLPLLLHVVSDAGPEGHPDLPPRLNGVVGGGAPLDDWLALAARTHHVGLSERFGDLVSARRHQHDAERAAQVAVRRGHFSGLAGEVKLGAVVRFEDVDLATWLLSARDEEATSAKVRQQLAELLDRDDLVETAITWLGCGLDVGAAAEALYLHPNSVRYRLHRIEEILQAPMSSPTIIANLYLAFHDRLAPH